MTSHPDDEKTGFMESLDGIRKLETDKVDLYRQKPRPPARLRQQHPSSSAPQRESVIDFAPQQVPDTFFLTGLPKKLQKRIKSGRLPIEDVLDLHGYRQHQAHARLLDFLQQASQRELRFVLVIHGKGYRSAEEARLKPLARRLLTEHAAVLAWCPASEQHGGEGASYVYLRKNA